MKNITATLGILPWSVSTPLSWLSTAFPPSENLHRLYYWFTPSCSGWIVTSTLIWITHVLRSPSPCIYHASFLFLFSLNLTYPPQDFTKLQVQHQRNWRYFISVLAFSPLLCWACLMLPRCGHCALVLECCYLWEIKKCKQPFEGMTPETKKGEKFCTHTLAENGDQVMKQFVQEDEKPGQSAVESKKRKKEKVPD